MLEHVGISILVVASKLGIQLVKCVYHCYFIYSRLYVCGEVAVKQYIFKLLCHGRGISSDALEHGAHLLGGVIIAHRLISKHVVVFVSKLIGDKPSYLYKLDKERIFYLLTCRYIVGVYRHKASFEACFIVFEMLLCHGYDLIDRTLPAYRGIDSVVFYLHVCGA